MTPPLLDVHDLSVRITRDEGVVRPLNGVSFRINAGQAVGIVGESGCGKTMTSNALLQILPPAAEITSGHIRYRRKLWTNARLTSPRSTRTATRCIRSGAATFP